MDKITKELEQNKAQQLKELSDDKHVNQVKALLDYNAAEDRALLKSMGLDKHLELADNAHSKLIELEKIDNEFGGAVYHIDNIKALCMDYRLRFLRTKYYNGTIDVQVPAKIKEFMKVNDINTSHDILERRFYILAPDECFNLRRREVPRIVDRDPALFYKVDEEHYRLIYKWGNDFTIFRAIKGWRWKSEGNYWLSSFLMALVWGSLIAAILLPMQWYAIGIYYLPCAGITILCFIYFMSRNWRDGKGVITENLTPESWNSNEYIS